jgi:flagellar L-ring protein precursor FlgH
MGEMNKLILVGILCIGLVSASSLWSDSARSPFVKKTNYKVGDTITIIIDENLSAAQSGSTRADKSSDFNFSGTEKADSSLSSTGGNARSQTDKHQSSLGVNFAGKNAYSGTGKTTRATSVRTNITATIIDVQPNGSIFVLGQRQIKVNDEVEQLEVSGIISPDKISDTDTVYSTQLANAKITIKGAGTVSSPQQPGVMSKMFGWLF